MKNEKTSLLPAKDALCKVDCVIERNKDLIDHLLGDKNGIYKNSTDGHDIQHITRVLRYAILIGLNEGGDEKVLIISAILHDAHRWMRTDENKYVSPQESLVYVEEVIKGLDLTDLQREKIKNAVLHHEDYNFNGEKQDFDIETLIIQDADNLDAMGAIGVVRTFKYGFSHNLPDYDEKVELYQQEKYYDGFKEASTIHHMHNKLIRLALTLNTPTAKALGQEKNRVMNDFIKAFISEWKGFLGEN